jgi:hypothetical protein
VGLFYQGVTLMKFGLVAGKKKKPVQLATVIISRDRSILTKRLPTFIIVAFGSVIHLIPQSRNPAESP